jgi:hypothetical protein
VSIRLRVGILPLAVKGITREINWAPQKDSTPSGPHRDTAGPQPRPTLCFPRLTRHLSLWRRLTHDGFFLFASGPLAKSYCCQTGLRALYRVQQIRVHLEFRGCARLRASTIAHARSGWWLATPPRNRSESGQHIGQKTKDTSYLQQRIQKEDGVGALSSAGCCSYLYSAPPPVTSR